MENNKSETKEVKKYWSEKSLAAMIYIIFIFLVLMVVFKLGTVVGARRADFSCRWSDNYHRNFGGPRQGFSGGIGDHDFLDANGIFGQIIKVDGNSFVISGRDRVEKVVLVDDKTVINSMKSTIKFSDLKTDDLVIVIGEPNDSGQIVAKLIRVMPPLPGPGQMMGGPADLPAPTATK